jgi:HAD superfamily hydrolase (TIGR01509 family)
MDAVIFDFDGTLLQSEQEWDKYLWPLALRAFPGVTKEDFDHLLGMTNRQGYAFFSDRFEPAMDWQTYQQEILNFIPELYASAPLSEGVLDLLKLLKAEGVPLGIATSSQRSWIEPSLDSHDVRKYFDTIVTVDDVENPKPAADPYLLAARKLGVDPRRSIGIEDSKHGLQSVKAAGMKSIVYAEQPLADEDLHIQHFHQLDLQTIQSLFE